MTNEYITLSTSGSEISKRFYAILNGYNEIHRKHQTVDINISGNPLITNGGVTRYFSYVLKLSQEMEDTNYGNKLDLIALYDLNDPNGDPPDYLTLIDHYGISHLVKFTEELSLSPLTTTIEGTDSYFYVPIKLIEVVNE